MSVQPEPSTAASFARPERRGVSRRSVIEEAKARVETIALAGLLCGPGQVRRMGEKWVGRCPLPDHADKTPSFTVYPGERGWFCYGCLRGGDVVELARFVWGYEKHEVAMAAADLLHEFGHSIPERPQSWYAKERRRKPVRDAIDEANIRLLQRRLFRIFLPLIEAIEDFDERREEIELVWRDTRRIAALVVAGRSS